MDGGSASTDEGEGGSLKYWGLLSPLSLSVLIPVGWNLISSREERQALATSLLNRLDMEKTKRHQDRQREEGIWSGSFHVRYLK